MRTKVPDVTIFDNDQRDYILLLRFALLAKVPSAQCIVVVRAFVEDTW